MLIDGGSVCAINVPSLLTGKSNHAYDHINKRSRAIEVLIR
jgi:hypothetical protein